MMRGSNMGILPYWPNILLIKPEPQLKRGLCLSHHARLHGVVLFKAASGLPLDICFYISLGALVVSEPTNTL